MLFSCQIQYNSFFGNCKAFFRKKCEKLSYFHVGKAENDVSAWFGDACCFSLKIAKKDRKAVQCDLSMDYIT